MNGEWAHYLKLQWTCTRLGFLIDWGCMGAIKDKHEAYRRALDTSNSDAASPKHKTVMPKTTGFVFDFHCGLASNETVGDFAKITLVRFVSQDPDSFHPNHRCLDKEKFSLSPTAKQNRCSTRDQFGLDKHPVVPGVQRQGHPVHLGVCGFQHRFADDIATLITSLDLLAQSFGVADIPEEKKSADLPFYPLTTYFHPLQSHAQVHIYIDNKKFMNRI